MPAVAPSFADLAERHRAEILAYLVRLLGDRVEAEDVCQDVFVRALRAFDRLAGESNTRAWLYRIATNAGLNAARGRRRRRRHAVDVDPDTLPARVVALADRRAELFAVARATAALPPRQRAALMLRQFQGLGYAEIAASLGGTAAGARANVYQALKKLRATLGGM